MFGRTSLLKATALSLSLGLVATAAQAGNIVDTARQTAELSKFSEAIAAAGLDQRLSGEGPFTVFAPTDQAFEQLPPGALEALMKQENRSQLTKLVQHHIMEGQELAAKDVLGKQTKVDTASGDTLTVDGTSDVVLLVPTGLTITQIGDRVVVEREGMAIPAGAVEVRDEPAKAGGAHQGQGQQTASRTSTAEPSDMPVSEHQQEVLQSGPAQEQQQTATQAGADMPATEHQQEVLAGDETSREQRQQTAARTSTAEQSGMPVTEHQQEVLESEPEQEQQQTAARAGTDMPATKHQREVLGEGQRPDEQGRAEQAPVPEILREAVVVEPDIEADNGVIHVIDAVLVPQSLLETLQSTGQRG